MGIKPGAPAKERPPMTMLASQKVRCLTVSLSFAWIFIQNPQHRRPAPLSERLVEHLQPGIADPAISRDADPALVLRVQLVLIGGRLARFFGVVHERHNDQYVACEPVFQP